MSPGLKSLLGFEFMVTLYPTTLMAGLWIVFKTNGLQQDQLYHYSFVLGLLVAFRITLSIWRGDFYTLSLIWWILAGTCGLMTASSFIINITNFSTPKFLQSTIRDWSFGVALLIPLIHCIYIRFRPQSSSTE